MPLLHLLSYLLESTLVGGYDRQCRVQRLLDQWFAPRQLLASLLALESHLQTGSTILLSVFLGIRRRSRYEMLIA